jgi:hypothetical protein
VAAPQPTGPVDFVPGLPGLGTPPVPQPATATPPVPTPAAPAPLAAAPSAQEPGVPGASWPQTLESEAPTPAPGRSRHLRGARGSLDRTALLGLGLAALALVLVLLGLSLRFGAESLWSTIPLWSAFAALCAAVGVLAFAPVYPGGRTGSAWRVAAVALLGLAVFWLLVVLPKADTDRGFLFTAALGALGAALWTGPRARS